MPDLPPDAEPRSPFLDFEFRSGIEVLVGGDESRTELARRIIDCREAVVAMAVRLLENFMRDRGRFGLNTIEVFPDRTADSGDFVVRFSFTADHDRDEYGYTYFEVYFNYHEPPQEPFWPFKFTVGFH